MKREDGILEVALHSGGGPLVFNGYVHEALAGAFRDIGDDRENHVVILTARAMNSVPGSPRMASTSSRPRDTTRFCARARRSSRAPHRVGSAWTLTPAVRDQPSGAVCGRRRPLRIDQARRGCGRRRLGRRPLGPRLPGLRPSRLIAVAFPLSRRERDGVRGVLNPLSITLP
jgi:hypothetical protein